MIVWTDQTWTQLTLMLCALHSGLKVVAFTPTGDSGEFYPATEFPVHRWRPVPRPGWSNPATIQQNGESAYHCFRSSSYPGPHSDSLACSTTRPGSHKLQWFTSLTRHGFRGLRELPLFPGSMWVAFGNAGFLISDGPRQGGVYDLPSLQQSWSMGHGGVGKRLTGMHLCRQL